MTREDITKWALSNGWRMLDGWPSLSMPSSPSVPSVRMVFHDDAAAIEARMPSGEWTAVTSAAYDSIQADAQTGYPVGLGIETLAARARALLSSMNIKDVFTEAYANKLWGSEESLSGCGSTLEATANLRRELPALFAKFDIRTVLDAPCGDMNWMRLVLEETPSIAYIGGDIVGDLIARNRERYAKRNVTFIELDITRDSLPKADLMICRDCLFHLPQRKVFDALNNFKRSDVRYLLTTSYVTDGQSNADIRAGFFFPIDLLAAPYHFPRDVLHAIEDWAPGHPPRRMYLWPRAQIPDMPAG